mgnify:FL=1|jgi:hypothetical protein
MANVPTGPDELHGGDGLPDWMQFAITSAMFGLFVWIIYLLFHATLADNFRDLLNIIVGGFLASFGKVVDFWFKHDGKKKSGGVVKCTGGK